MLYFAPWKVALIFILTLAGILYTAPNFVPKDKLESVPTWLPHQQINLGLDLRGGSYLLLEVDSKAVAHDRLQSLINDVRRVLREQKALYTGLSISGDSVTVRITKPEDVEKSVEAIRSLSTMVNTGSMTNLAQRDLEVSSTASLITVSLTEAAKIARIQSAVTQSIEIVRRRVDELGTTEPVIQQQGPNRILVQVPGLSDPKRLKDLLGKTAKLNFRMVDTTMRPEQVLAGGTMPAGSEILDSQDTPGEKWLVERRVIVGGENLLDAQPSFDQRTNEPVVSFRFDSTGARLFGEATVQNTGKPFAIVLDGKVVSAPRINEPILGGQGQISGAFSVQGANDLAILLRAGALPAPLTVLEERTIGPGLGADSIRAGTIASVIGFVGVVIFMIMCYGFFGLLANIALIINVAMIMGILSALQATLTLPGIAGIVLTIGMAVDANVLIYERIREEIRIGKTPIQAVEMGYTRAYGTILDSNITNFISAAILFQIGSGPVKGFAVAHAIGIITSVYTGFTVNRYMVSLWLRYRRPKTINL
jgi:preprotein translocase subunit SecD